MEDWRWSDEQRAPVRVVGETTLWGRTTLKVLDTNGVLHHVGSDRIRSLNDAEPALTSLRRMAAIHRLADHLSRPDTLTAHLSPTLLPLPHQISHVERALNSPTTRLLIADEVGLGKTISAALIIREMLNRELIRRILILVPAGLVAQWILELRTHVDIEPTPLFTSLSPTPNAARVWTDHDVVITSHDAARPMTKRQGWSTARIAERNAARFDGVVSVPWDVVIIDEAHKMAGATTGVARHALASALAGTAPHLLLLTGTPHQGKADQFHRLVELLDAEVFPNPDAVTREQVERHLIRVDKQEAVDLDGKALFVERATHLHVIPQSDRRASETLLETEMREYIRDGYAKGRVERKGGYGLLMSLFGRLLGSSTAALTAALENRRMALLGESTGSPDYGENDEESPIDLFSPKAIDGQESPRLEQLIQLAHKIRSEGADTKAKALISLLRNLERLEKDPDVKVLIFTEFTATQSMLSEWLSRHGVSNTILNGSMGIEVRLESLRAFRERERVLISTEAGGEGLNLQFCHLVVNYDLPWNPMRVEQRIGRVHRIGQKMPVNAYNIVLDGSTEARVLEVIQAKLQQIFEQLGVDKLSDVLDSSEVESDFDRLYRIALESGDDEAIREAEQLFDDLLEKAQSARAETIIEPTAFDIEAIRERLSVPVNSWATMIEPDSNGDLRHPAVMKAMRKIRPVAPGEKVVVTFLPDFPDLQGWWSLWKITVIDLNGTVTQSSVLPLFVDDEGKSFTSAGQRVWDAMLASNPKIQGYRNVDEELVTSLQTVVEEAGASNHQALWSASEKAVLDENARLDRAFTAQSAAISRLGLPEVRQYRLRKLDEKTTERRESFQRRLPSGSRLEPLQIVRIEGGDLS